jgi:16S rRNA U516 pseudouridylate synthase RsuA-like enzyme
MQGVTLDDGLATADACFVVVPSNRFTATGRLKRATLLWQIHDGRNRIIRRITEKLNSKVIELH